VVTGIGIRVDSPIWVFAYSSVRVIAQSPGCVIENPLLRGFRATHSLLGFSIEDRAHRRLIWLSSFAKPQWNSMAIGVASERDIVDGEGGA
jgi:hypothetical protein